MRERERERERESWSPRKTLGRNTSSERLSSSYFFHGRLIQGRISTRGLPSPLASAQNGGTCLLGCLPTYYPLRLIAGVENFCRYRFFGRIHTLHSSVPPTEFSWDVRCLLITLRHNRISYFETHKITGLSKVSI